MGHDLRQAVLVIHGMGEQRPMATLRAFADAAIPEREGAAGSTLASGRYHSKPDKLTDSFELRRYVAPSTRDRPVTDLYELYWADLMTGTTLRDLAPLARALLCRWPARLSSGMRVFWLLGWFALAAVAAVAVMTVLRTGPFALLDGPVTVLRAATGTSDDTVAASSAWGWIVLVVVLVGGWVVGRAIASFGDVARYLDSQPGNVGVRHDIKALARDTLKRLHESGRYSRIVVVGHSLGSIIGLDAITHYWGEVSDRHGAPTVVDQKCLDAIEAMGPGLTGADEDLDRFRDGQRDLWAEQRRNGSPWLVTDFVTLGSPLTHAAWLVAANADALVLSQRRKEVLTCPPQPDGRPVYSYRTDYDVPGGRRSLFVLNSSAAFACTRWTNLWFPTRFGVFGDPFGGPLQPWFGPGICDREIKAGRRWTRWAPVVGHVHYWSDADRPHTGDDHIDLLRTALDLSSTAWLRGATGTPSTPTDAQA